MTAAGARTVQAREGDPKMVNCPLCSAVIDDVDEDELDEGDSLICEDCGANLNVTGVSPLELTAGEEDDDDDDDEDEEYDEYDEDDEDEEEDEEDE
jgi:alpha-aminoadipate carrier protein LysW